MNIGLKKIVIVSMSVLGNRNCLTQTMDKVISSRLTLFTIGKKYSDHEKKMVVVLLSSFKAPDTKCPSFYPVLPLFSNKKIASILHAGRKTSPFLSTQESKGDMSSLSYSF